MEKLTEEGIKAALRRLTEDTRRIRLDLARLMGRRAGASDHDYSHEQLQQHYDPPDDEPDAA